MKDDQEAAEGRMTERGSECEEEEEEEEKKGDELKAEGKGEEEEPVLLAPCSSNSSCILLTFPSSITGHLIAPKTGPMGPKSGHNRFDYLSMAAPTHPNEPSDFPVRRAPNTQPSNIPPGAPKRPFSARSVFLLPFQTILGPFVGACMRAPVNL